ncbi:uncharacterized protein TM35_000112170 [Trypanosoma theileri]|uniref:Uncharacterized protein n=1 Tax=Trypanosoma theileri TaxID=67003 RepID=A0A1X0NYY6_9TRYP|nr:uncharacterized protein TM35_000112170 [Trypanosoma theileri]ORC89683.1 hypothetical protein TM35_000112170 [Trypanosoma theileri]
MAQNINTTEGDQNIDVNRNNSQEDDGGIQNSIYQQYVFVSAKSLRIDKFRLENVAMCFATFCSIIFSIVALATPITHLKENNIEISITAWGIKRCIQSNCKWNSIDSICPIFASAISLFVAMIFVHLFFALTAFIIIGFMVFGRIVWSKYLGIVFAFFSLVLGIVDALTAVSIQLTYLCSDIPLDRMGFRYGPAVIVMFTDIILLGLTSIVYIARLCCFCTPRYFTE